MILLDRQPLSDGFVIGDQSIPDGATIISLLFDRTQMPEGTSVALSFDLSDDGWKSWKTYASEHDGSLIFDENGNEVVVPQGGIQIQAPKQHKFIGTAQDKATLVRDVKAQDTSMEKTQPKWIEGGKVVAFTGTQADYDRTYIPALVPYTGTVLRGLIRVSGKPFTTTLTLDAS